jgi:hypothetical protein
MINFTNQLIRKCQAAAVADDVTFLGTPLTFLLTLPALMQEVQTLNFLGRPFTKALTGCKLGYQRREVLLLACETFLPKLGLLPHISQAFAIIINTPSS